MFGCETYPEVRDHGRVCASIQTDDANHVLQITADSQDCAADHKDAKFECSLVVDDTLVTIETRFQDGKDPNDGCAGPLVAQCEAPVSAGEYTARFDDQDVDLVVPGTDDFCFGVE